MKTKNYICKNCKKIAVDWKGNSEKTCPKCEPNLDDAQHPLRQIAIRLIEETFEPWLEQNRGDDIGIEGEEYYELEDKITDLLVESQKINSK